MAKNKNPTTDDHRQAAILIAVLMNEMALADRYESLSEAASIDGSIIDHYANYSAAALDGFSKHNALPQSDRTPDAAVFFMSVAIAEVDGIVPVKEKHIRYAKAAQMALQAFGNVPPEIDPIDAHVGKRLRFARALRGLSQERLAAMEGLTFQQQQKYEKGLNRVSASRLYHLAEHLQLPVAWFFEGLPNPSGDEVSGFDMPSEYALDDRETRRLIGLFHSVEDRAKRKALLSVVQSAIELMD